MLEGVNVGQVYELGTRPMTLGRHPSNTVQLTDEAASSYHAEIAREPIGYVLTDLGSTNGTRVCAKGKAEFEKIVKTPLSVGIRVKVGKTVLQFDNIGKPIEDEALFGTVALEPDKLEQKLATEPSSGRSWRKARSRKSTPRIGSRTAISARAPTTRAIPRASGWNAARPPSRPR
ncbi:MAG: FHA domain-containing protein [Planctomycetota bacterium]|nr:FHA domain-containing protein [Planctomycetota bacterium]